MREKTKTKKYNYLESRRQNYIICSQYDGVSLKKEKRKKRKESRERMNHQKCY